MGQKDRHSDFVRHLGIKEPKVDKSILDKPTRPPLPQQTLIERTAFREERKPPLEEPRLRRPSTPSIAPAVAEEAKEIWVRLRKRIASWDAQEPQRGDENSSRLQKLGQRMPGAHLQGKRNLNILIVDSVSFYQDAIKLAIEQTVPTFFPDTTARNVHSSNCFNYALFKLQDSETAFDLLILSHKLHLTPSPFTEAQPEFQRSLEPIGYSLMEIVRSEFPELIVIGTAIEAELSGEEISPDFTMKKRWGEATKSLREIMEEIHMTSKQA